MKQINEALREALLKTVEILEENTLLDTCLGFDGSPCKMCKKEKTVIAEARAALKLAEDEEKEIPCGGCAKVQKHGVHACEACKE